MEVCSTPLSSNRYRVSVGSLPAPCPPSTFCPWINRHLLNPQKYSSFSFYRNVPSLTDDNSLRFDLQWFIYDEALMLVGAFSWQEQIVIYFINIHNRGSNDTAEEWSPFHFHMSGSLWRNITAVVICTIPFLYSPTHTLQKLHYPTIYAQCTYFLTYFKQ